MTMAPRPDSVNDVPQVPGFVLLAGDTHCHVTPPDSSGHVSRGLAETVALAESESLDFVILTPHLWDRTLDDSPRREEARAEWRALRERVGTIDSEVLFVPGFEYTSRRGHATFAFADVDEALRERDVPSLVRRWTEAGGLIFVNHPLLTPFGAPIRNARWDLSWSLWTDGDGPWSDDVVAIHRAAVGWEAYNLSIDFLHDRHYQSRPGVSRRSVMAWLDRAVVREGRRMTPVGGSDSHSSHLRAATFVLATSRTVEALRDAFASGRTCVASPWPCTLVARATAGGPFEPVGATIQTRGWVEVRLGVSGEVLLGGRVVAEPSAGQTVRLATSGDCTVLRARADGGASAPIYLDCDILDGAP
jgi:hypothetical protein